MVSVVISHFSFLILLIWALLFSWWVWLLLSHFSHVRLCVTPRTAADLSILFIFSKNEVLVSLIFCIVFRSLFHLFLLWSFMIYFLLLTWILFLLLFLVLLGIMLRCLLKIFLFPKVACVAINFPLRNAFSATHSFFLLLCFHFLLFSGF